MNFTFTNNFSLRQFILITILLVAFIAGDPVSAATVKHGPVVGAVTPTSARMVVRTDTTANIFIELDTDSSFTNPVQTEAVATVAERHFFAICSISGLLPNTRYYYRTYLDDVAQDEVRSFLTFIEPGTETTFSFSFGSGQQALHDSFSMKGHIFPVMAEEEPQFFLQIGDWSYPDMTYEKTSPPDDFYFALNYDRVLSSYEFKYDPNFPLDELLSVTAVDYVFDDHDMVSDNSDRTFPGIANALRGYDEAFPHYPLANEENGIWHKFSCGEADFFMLDTRTQRDPNEATLDSLPDGTLQYVFKPDHLLLSSDTTISGELQIDWLLRELQESTATWKFLVSTVAFNPAERSTTELALLLQGTALDPLEVPGQGPMSTAEIAIAFTDRWGGFPATIQKILRYVSDQGIENVIVLSGDSHNTAIDDGTNSFFPELMGGGLDRNNSQEVAMEGSFGIPLWNQGGQYYELGNFNNAYGKVTVFGSDSVLLEAIDEEKTLIADYTVKPGYNVETIGIAAAPQGQTLFGEVEIGKTSLYPIILMSTGCDTLLIHSVKFTGSGFSTMFPPRTILPGHANRLAVVFRPTEARLYQEAVILETNAPVGTLTLPVVGTGINPAGVDKGETALPFTYDLKQNYPNPFNASTKISYSLKEQTNVQVAIYSSTGQFVRTYDLTKQSQGHHSLIWDGSNMAQQPVASGVYFVRIKANDFSAVRKMVLIK